MTIRLVSSGTIVRVVLASLVLIAQAISAQPSAKVLASGDLPDTPVGQRAEALIEAFNTGGLDVLEAFVASNMEPAALRQRGTARSVASYWAGVFAEAGPLTFHSKEDVTLGGRTREVLWFQADRTRAWMGIALRVEENSPHQLTGYSVIRGLRPSTATPLDVSEDELPAYLKAYLTSIAEHDRFSGNVLIAKNDIIIFEGSYGDVKPDSRFRLASVTKMFTGIAIAQLAEAGKLNFDDPISKHIPEYPKHVADKVTIHQLLTHQSGIELDDYGRYNREIEKAKCIEELLTIQLKYLEHLNRGNYENFEPLGSYDYTNEGIDLLGVIIERASGKNWSKYIQKNIFAKAGMKYTGVDTLKGDPGLVTGYTGTNRAGMFLAERRAVNGEKENSALRPAGSGWSTTHDMYAFINALNMNKLLSPEMTKTVLSPHINTGIVDYEFYGYTFDIDLGDTLPIFGHRGGAPGISTAVRHYPDIGYTVIVLSNYSRAGDVALNHIEDILAAF
ncbi:MAG: serine hydrolase domain-containing protein [Candidatus Hydrogenedentota bacterium]